MKAYMSVSQFEREYHIGRPEDYDATLGHGSYTRRNAVAASVEEARRILAETEPRDVAFLDDDTPVHAKPYIFTFGTATARLALAESLAAFVAE